MKRQWKQIVLTVAGAVGSTIVAALLRRDTKSETPFTNNAAAANEPTVAPSGSVRGGIVGLVSDILAETYRKIQSEQREKRR